MVYQYKVQLDVDDTRAYTSGLCDLYGVTEVNWSAGMGVPYQQISTPAMLRIVLSNADGRYDIDDENSDYYGLIHPGRLIRVQSILEGVTVTMTELRIVDVQEVFGEFVLFPTLVITCQDKIKELLEFEYDAPLQQDVTTDEPITEIHRTAEVVWPNNRSYFFVDQDAIDGTKELYNLDDIDFQTGRTTLNWAGDALGQGGQSNAQRIIRDMLKAEIFGIYFFQPRTGMYRFLNRLHATDTAASVALRTDGNYLTQAQTSRGRNPYGLGPLNTMKINYIPRVVGTPSTIIYTADDVPIRLEPHTVKTIRARYYDPDNDDARIGAVDVIPLQRGVDITINRKANGSGQDALKRVAIQHEAQANVSIITLENTKNKRVYVTSLQVRGTPLITYQRKSVEARNDESFYRYDAFAADDTVVLENEETVQALANMLVNAFGEPRKVVERLSLVVTDEIAETVQSLTIGDCVTVQNSNETHNQKYMIVGEQHRVQWAIGRHDVTYILRQAKITSLFMIDSSEIDGTDILDI